MKHIKVKVFPDCKREKIEQIQPEAFHVYLRESAQNNMANKGLLRSMAKYLDIPQDNIHFVRGHRTRNKILEIHETKNTS